MMAVGQRSCSGIEEVLVVSDGEDDEVVVIDDDDQTTKFEETKEFIHVIDCGPSYTDRVYDNGDFEHLPQLFANEDLRKTKELYFDEYYDLSDVSNHSSDETVIIQNVNLSDKENVPLQECKRIESNDRNIDSDDEQFYIAEDCNTKDIFNDSESNEKIGIDVGCLSNNHKGVKININANKFRNEYKITNADSPKNDSVYADAEKLLINDHMDENGKEESTDKLQCMKLDPEKLMIQTSSEDDSEDAQDDQVLMVSQPYQGLKSSKRLLRMHCEKCDIKICVPKLHQSEACNCRLCDSAMVFQCNTCKRGFKTYWAAFSHLKRECAAKYFWHCPECGYAVRDQSKFDLHMQKGHERKTLSCSHCRKRMHDQKTLDKHLQMSCPMKVPRYHCNNCDFKERLLSKIKKHVMMSHCVLEGGYTKINFRPTIAKEKTTEYTSESNATDVGASVPTEPKVMDAKLNMEKLIKLHCTKCKITFKKTADINTKCKYCSSSMLYQCKMCKERSKSLCGIYDHLDNNCEFVICKQCNNRFKTKIDAIKHKEVCGRLLLKCRFCTFKTKLSKNLQVHINNKHSDAYINAQK